MKITYEFDTLSEDFIPSELYKFQNVDNMAFCLNDIIDQIMYWWENKDTIDTETLHKEIFDIIQNNNIIIDKLLN